MAEKEQRAWNLFSILEKDDYLNTHEPDCSFLVGSDAAIAKTFPSHKFILSSVSQVFERMFNGDFKEATSCHDIPIEDVEEPADFKKFLDCLYFEDNDSYYTVDTLITLVYLSDKYSIDSLAKKFHQIILSKRNQDRLLMKELLSLFLYDYSKGVDLCGFNNRGCPFVNDMPLYLNTLLKRSAELRDMNRIYNLDVPRFSTLLKILMLRSAASNASSIFIFHMIERYAAQNGLDMNSSSNTLKPMLKYVDFNSMSLAEFGNGPMCSKIFSSDQKYDILVELCKKHGHFNPN